MEIPPMSQLISLLIQELIQSDTARCRRSMDGIDPLMYTIYFIGGDRNPPKLGMEPTAMFAGGYW